MKRYAYLIGLVVLVIDQVTKIWAEKTLSDGSEISVIGDLLTFVLVYNPGAAFSFGTGSTWFFTIFSVVVLIGIILVLRKCGSLPWALVLGAIGGGAAGNFVDRIAREPSFGQGHVVDFINYNGYFVGNVADIALVLGVVAVLILELKSIPFAGTAAEETDDE